MGNILSCWPELRFFRRRQSQSPETFRPSSNFVPHSNVGYEYPNIINTVPDESPTSSDLVIGIDFGTTFTGAAYASTAGIGKATSLAEMQTVADKISVIKAWPNPTNVIEGKIPSVLAYNREPPAWGGNVKPTDEPRIAYFKLGLEEDVTSLYQQHSPRMRNSESILGGYLSDSNWRHPMLPEKGAINYVTDFLSCINRFVTEEFLPSRFGAIFLQNQKLSYVLTVPAIWSDKAKELTRTAAVKAGIDSGNLTLITEPEAAALYCATLCNEVDLEQGDRFMICDAGGGTVVRILQVTVDG
jgi:hypothetical protein